MTINALKLIGRVILLKESPLSLIYGARNSLNRWLGNGNRRYEFERLYLERGDVWNYETSAYERVKYEHTLQRILSLRRRDGTALEVGCSIGVFSEWLASHFDHVTAIDISQEALVLASRRGPPDNIKFIRSGICDFDVERKYDAIVCAEVLYYIPESEMPNVVSKLGELLSDKGIIVTVSGVPISQADALYFDGWNDALKVRFKRIWLEDFDDLDRPYRIAVFAGENVEER